MGITVRRAKPTDLGWIIAELRKFSEFYGTRKSLFGSEGNAERFMNLILEKHLMFVAVKDGVGNLGFIAGLISPHFFNPEIRTLNELFWWVTEDHRGSRAGLLLLEAFNRWGEENVDWITFSLEDKSPVDERCLVKRGFRLQERNYLREVAS